MKCNLNVMSSPFSKSLKRQAAPGMLVKVGIQNQNNEQENHRECLKYGTHTTLPSCFPAVPAYPQKTATYAPIQSHRWNREARVCHGLAYGRAIEAPYFNGLISRCPLPLSALQER
jgi:hypothetical protein